MISQWRGARIIYDPVIGFFYARAYRGCQVEGRVFLSHADGKRRLSFQCRRSLRGLE